MSDTLVGKAHTLSDTLVGKDHILSGWCVGKNDTMSVQSRLAFCRWLMVVVVFVCLFAFSFVGMCVWCSWILLLGVASMVTSEMVSMVTSEMVWLLVKWRVWLQVKL